MDLFAKNAERADDRKIATALSKNYRPLVEMFVVSPGGQISGRQSMNDDIMEPFAVSSDEVKPDLEAHFLQFLREPAKFSPKTISKIKGIIPGRP